jgi:hypothetical protein
LFAIVCGITGNLGIGFGNFQCRKIAAIHAPSIAFQN